MRILFVARPYSIHAARWIMQLRHTGWDVHVFPATAHKPCGQLSGITMHDGWRCALERTIHVEFRWPVHKRGVERVRKLCQRIADVLPDRSDRLARVIRRVQPDIVHSLEMQHAGYLTLAARRKSKDGFPPWIVQNWGSDIYLFGRLAAHRDRIREVLKACNYYDCECDRDVELARRFGFEGTVLPVIPNGGGYDFDAINRMPQPKPPSQRRVIMIKGYQGWAGRALVAVAALSRVADLLDGYTVRIYSARTEDVHIAGELFSSETGIPVEFIPPVSHDEMLRLHGEARISIGLSISDSISISLLEAMIMGAFPIQSDTSVAADWITPGESGSIVPAEDPQAVAEALRRALTDDALVDRASRMNAAVTRVRLDGDVIVRHVIAMYEDVFRTAQLGTGRQAPAEASAC